jgi:hypothetical protein
MNRTRTLKKTIDGASCDIFAVIHHQRLRVGSAVPVIEVYEDSVEVPTIGSNSIRYKRTCFSVIVCPDPEMDEEMTAEKFFGLMSFDLSLKIPRKDEVIVPFLIYEAASVELSPECWKFEISDQEMVRKLLAL